MRIIIIRPGALGDTLLMLPTLVLLRRALPAAHVTLIARRDALPLTSASGLADETSPYDLPQWSTLFAETPPLHGSACDVLHGADAVISWLSDSDGHVARNLATLGVRRVVSAPGKPALDAAEHFALTLARVLEGLAIPSPQTLADLLTALPLLQAPPADVTQATAAWAALGLAQHSNPVVAFHPGAGGAAKRWPPDHFARLAESLWKQGMMPLLIEGPQDTELTLEITRQPGFPLPVARNLSIGALASLLQRCAAFVGNDSGVTHVAALMNVPTLALFGPTDPRVWRPLGRRVHICSAPTGHMATLSVSAVLSALTSLLEE